MLCPFSSAAICTTRTLNFDCVNTCLRYQKLSFLMNIKNTWLPHTSIVTTSHIYRNYLTCSSIPRRCLSMMKSVSECAVLPNSRQWTRKNDATPPLRYRPFSPLRTALLFFTLNVTFGFKAMSMLGGDAYRRSGLLQLKLRHRKPFCIVSENWWQMWTWKTATNRNHRMWRH